MQLRNRVIRKKHFETVNKCALCGYTQYKHFLTVPDRNYQTGNFEYVQCNNCQLVWLNPRPSLKTLYKYYPLTYPAHRKLRSTTKTQQFVRNIIKRGVLAHLFIKDQLYYWKQKGRILDVGTGNGVYLTILKEWGWDPYGIEINKEVVKRAKKYGVPNISQGTIHTTKYKDGFFDAIRYSHVLEHVPSPVQDINAAYKLLKKGGSIIITVPNINSWLFKIFGSFWYPLEPPRHFYQFSDITLPKLLLKHKFTNVLIKYIQSPNPVVWSIKYALGMNNVERKLKYVDTLAGLLLLPLTWIHASDIIEVTAQK